MNPPLIDYNIAPEDKTDISRQVSNRDFIKNFPLSYDSNCNISKLDKRLKVLNHAYKHRVLTVEELHILQCFIHTIYIPEILSLSDSNIDNFWKNYTDTEYMGSDETVITDRRYPFVMKITDPYKYPYNEENHELEIGISAINRLRDKIPNFVFTLYGSILPCLSNFPKELKENKCEVIFTEQIPGISIHKYASRLNTNKNNFIIVFFQLVLALQFALTEIDFTHYDLHQENIIIRDIDDSVRIDYIKYSIMTDQIVTFIDFGSAHAKINNVNYGKKYAENYGIYSDESFWIMDIVKILLNITYSTYPSFRTKREQENYEEEQYNYDNTIENKDQLIELYGNEYIEEMEEQWRSAQERKRKIKDIIKYDEIHRKEFHTMMQTLLSYFFGPELLHSKARFVRLIKNYGDKHPYLHVEKTNYNKDINIGDFIDFIITNFPEVKSIIV